MQVPASGKLHLPNISDQVFAFFPLVPWSLQAKKGCNVRDVPKIFVSGWGESWRYTSVKDLHTFPSTG